jgi:AcrR family transcriptional regulator
MPGSRRAEPVPERFAPDELADLPAELALAQLPAGRHGLPRSFVAQNQRLRIIAGMLRVLPRQGFAETTIGHVTTEAGVSRSAFYSQFESKEDCFLATYDISAGWLCERVEAAAFAAKTWPEQVEAGVSEALRLLAGNPDVAHLIAVESLQAGPAARARRQLCIARLADALRAGRPASAAKPGNLEELLVGGALSLIARDLEAGRVEELIEVTPDLVGAILFEVKADRN